MSGDPGYDDAISRVAGSRHVPELSAQNEDELIYSVAFEPQIDQLRYSEDDITEALQICQTVEDAVADDGQNAGGIDFVLDPNCKSSEESWNKQQGKISDSHILAHRTAQLNRNNVSDPVYKETDETLSFNQTQQNNTDISRTSYSAIAEVHTSLLVHPGNDMLIPVYQGAAETLNRDVEIREASVLRRTRDTEDVYSFAKETERASDLVDKRHGIHGETALSVHGDIDGLYHDQNLDETENQYISLKDVGDRDDNTFLSDLKSHTPKTDLQNITSDNNTNIKHLQRLVNTQNGGEYEFVDYAKVKTSRRGQHRHEAFVQKKSAVEPQKKPGLMVSEKDRKTAKQKSRALKRGHPFSHHSALQDPKDGALGELEDSSNLTDFVNPFNVPSDSDSYESFTDSSFDSCNSDLSDGSFHSGDDGPPTKPLPLPPERKKKIPNLKNLINQHHFSTLPKTVNETTILPVVSSRPRPPPALPDPPGTMTPSQVKMSQVLESLANSEKSYIESLERLHTQYTPTFKKFGLLEKSDVDKLFKTVEVILNLHKIGQIEMGDKFSQWYTHEKIGALFNFFSKDMVIDPYSDYVNHYEAVNEIIKDATNSKPAFLEELKEKQYSSTDRLSLAGLMLKPIQRFPQFIMIIKDILKHTPRNHHDRENLQEGLTGIENVAHQLNEGKRRSEQKFHGQEIISKLSAKLPPDKKAYLIRQDDVKQLSEEVVGGHQNQTKTRRLFLLNDKLVSVSVTQREQDGNFVEKFTYKWSQKLEDLELQMSAIMPHMATKVTGAGPTSIVSPKPDGKEEDPFQLASDLSDMLHDVSVLARISHLASTLKCSYLDFSEDTIQKLTVDLQAQIQNKDYQLQLLNSSSIILRDKVKSKKYVFETSSPAVKQEWYIDFMLAKYALDVVNIPSWYQHDSTSSVSEMSAFLMKHMSVDMQRTYSRIKCAIPVYLPVSSEGLVEHIWVCSSTESVGQVSLISLHTPKPSLVMSFKATDCEIETVVSVPGFALEKGPAIFEEDSVWISTAKSEICVFLLHENMVKQQDSAKKMPIKSELTQFVHRFKPGCVVISMVYQDDSVFCGTRKGTVIVYGRDDTGTWASSGTLTLCEGYSVTSMVTVGEGIWVACGRRIFIVAADSMDEYKIQDEIDCQKDNQIPNTEVQFLTKSGVGVWVSFFNQSKLYLYHMESKKFLQEVDFTTAINNFISVYTGIKETRKDHKVTSLVASLGLLWVGTSDGIILTYPIPRLRDGVPKINQRPQVSLHGHNGPVKFLLPVHYGPVNGMPIKRKVSALLKKSESEQGLPVATKTRTDTDNEVFEDCRETPTEQENIYESVRLSKGSQHEYESNMNIKLETRSAGNVTDLNENIKPNDSSDTLEESILTSKGESAIKTSEIGESGQDLQASDEHTYFILEPSTDKTDDTCLQTEPLNNTKNSDTVQDNKDVVKQLSFNSELAQKIQERKTAKELEELVVDEAEIDDLYGFLKSETKVNSSRTLSNSGQFSETELDRGQQSSMYMRYGFSRPIEVKKPNEKSVKRRSSFLSRMSKNVAFEVEKQEISDKHKVGSSFSGGSSVDTLRKQDTKTMLVISGGNGYKDWKKRQNLQYRMDEACLVIWMYKV